MDSARNRLFKILKSVISVLLIGIVYYIFVKLTNVGIPCPIYALTGKYCPGCGISRMFIALLNFDLAAAFKANCLVLILSPIILLYALIKSIQYIKTGRNDQSTLENIAILIVAIAVIAFGIMRNMDAFNFLAPQ